MTLDDQGKAIGTGKFDVISASMLVLALGQDPDTEFLNLIPEIDFKRDGSIVVDEKLMTKYLGIFSGGDVITDNRSVTISIGHGKKAAHCIDAYLLGKNYKKPFEHELASCDFLHLDMAKNVNNSKGIVNKVLPSEVRVKDFAEVFGGIEKEQALEEAQRCFSCGNCFECDGCFNICPVKAIEKCELATTMGATTIDKPYVINLNTCIGCSKCFRRCSCGAIKMTDNS